jgi:chaperonin GroES
MKLIPLHDNVVIERDKAATQSAGGILLPDAEKAQTGTVIAVGPGRIERGALIPIDFKKGARVFFGRYIETTLLKDERELIILDAESIKALIED